MKNGEEELARLVEGIAAKWISSDTLVKVVDSDHEGIVVYDAFYDTLNQFGLTYDLDIELIFKEIGKDSDGLISKDLLINKLEPTSQTKKKNKDFNQKSASMIGSSSFKMDQLQEMHKSENLRVGLVAHNHMKPTMMRFVEEHLDFFRTARIVTTGSTGRALSSLGLKIDTAVSSGPLGGDQEIGGMISRGEVAAVFFFTDPLSAHPHDDDIKALVRICAVHDTLMAMNPSTGYAVVHALKETDYGHNVLQGDYANKETSIVMNYKAGQKAVIADVSKGAIAGVSKDAKKAQFGRKGSVVFTTAGMNANFPPVHEETDDEDSVDMEKFVPSETALLLLNFQKENTDPSGKLYANVKASIEGTQMMTKIPSLVNAAREAGVLIIHSPVNLGDRKSVV